MWKISINYLFDVIGNFKLFNQDKDDLKVTESQYKKVCKDIAQPLNEKDHDLLIDVIHHIFLAFQNGIEMFDNT